MNQPLSKVAMDKTTSVVSYATQGTVGLGGLLSSEWVMVISAVFFAALTAAVNWWYQRRKEQRDAEYQAAAAKLDAELKAAHNVREEEYHAARMAAFRPSDEASGD